MTDAGFFRGTSSEQDARFYNKEKKLKKSLKYPPNIGVKIDMEKVNLDVIKPWITSRITDLLGFEDDVVIDFIFNLLEKHQYPDPQDLQLNVTGFLNGKNARMFMQELWDLLISAQQNVGGIPSKFLDQKKEEIRLKKLEQERVSGGLQSHTDAEREMLERRQREYEAREAERKNDTSRGLLPTPETEHQTDVDGTSGTGLDVNKDVASSKDEPLQSQLRRSPSVTRSQDPSPSPQRPQSNTDSPNGSRPSPSANIHGSASPELRNRPINVRRCQSRSPDRKRSPYQRMRSPHNRRPTTRRRDNRSSPSYRRSVSQSPQRKRSPPSNRRRDSPSPRQRRPRRRSRSPNSRSRPSYSPVSRRRSHSRSPRRYRDMSPRHRRRSPVKISRPLSPPVRRKRPFSPRRSRRITPSPRTRSYTPTPPHKRPENDVCNSDSERSEVAVSARSTSTSGFSVDLSDNKPVGPSGSRRHKSKQNSGGRNSRRDHRRTPSPSLRDHSSDNYYSNSSFSRSSSSEAEVFRAQKSQRNKKRVSPSPEYRHKRYKRSSSDGSYSISERSMSHSPYSRSPSPFKKRKSRKRRAHSSSSSRSPSVQNKKSRSIKAARHSSSGNDGSGNSSERFSSPPPVKKHKKHHKQKRLDEEESPSSKKHKKKHKKKQKKHSKKSKKSKHSSGGDMEDGAAKEEKLREKALKSMMKAKE